MSETFDWGLVLAALYEQYQWTVTGENYEDIVWASDEADKPSELTLRSQLGEATAVFEDRHNAAAAAFQSGIQVLMDIGMSEEAAYQIAGKPMPVPEGE